MARKRGTDLGELLLGTSGRDRLFGLGGDDELRGGDKNDFLDGGAGRDLVFGDEGNDVLVGGTAAPENEGEDDDVLDGGSGQDWVTYESLDEGLVINLEDQHASSTRQTDQLVSIENAIGSANFSDMTGSAGNNTLVAVGAGAVFRSTAGDDTYIDRAAGNVTLTFHADPTGISLNAQKGIVTDGFGGIDHFNHLDSVVGSGSGDMMIGSKRRDDFDGSHGDDTIQGREGNDLLTGGSGNDVVDGGRGIDWLVIEDFRDDGAHRVDLGAGTDTIPLFESDEVEVDTLLGIENVAAPGGNHTLIGDAGANRLVDVAGGTTIVAGGTTMTGGAGADQFQQSGSGFVIAPDIITDFEKGVDLIAFEEDAAFSFDGQSDLIPLGKLSADRFALGAAADADDLFIFDAGTGSLSIDLDGNGPIGQVALMTIANDVQIAAEDIVIVPTLDSELFA